MSRQKITRALVSVSNKQGLQELAVALHNAGVEIISRPLLENKSPYIKVAFGYTTTLGAREAKSTSRQMATEQFGKRADKD